MSDRIKDKFFQPVEAIHIIHKTEGPRTLLPFETLEAARLRVAAGEDPEKVAEELAILEASLLEEFQK